MRWEDASSNDYRPDLPEANEEERAALALWTDNLSVLDFGCGYGRLAPMFEALLYLGVDVNEACVLEARRRYPKHHFEITRPLQAYLPRDVVIAWAVLLHIDDEYLKAVVGKLRECSGRLVVVEHMDPALRDGDGVCFNRDWHDYVQAFGPCNVLELRKLSTGASVLVMDGARS